MVNLQSLITGYHKVTRAPGGLIANTGKALALTLLLAQSVFAAQAVGPVTNEPTIQFIPGKVIWVDLVTRDVAQAASFYRDVFGWEIAFSSCKVNGSKPPHSDT